MENGVGMADDSIRVDNKIVEERDAIEKVEERAVEVFDEIKDVEDEVFEEAIGTQEHLQELIESAEMGDSSGVAAAIGNGETIGDSGSEEVKENLNSEPEAETFEEAIGFPSDVGPQEDVIPSEVGPQLDVVLDDVGPEVDVIPSEVGPNDDVTLSVDEQKVEELMVGENVGCGLVSDNIDGGGTEIGAGTDELTGGKEVPEINGTGEREVLREEDKGNMKSNTGIEKHVHGEADKEDLDRTLAEEKLETLGVDMVEEDVKMDSKLEVLPQVGKVEESREDALATDYQGKKAGESSDTSADMVVKLQDYELEALNDKSTNVDTGDREKESTEVKSARADPDLVDGDEGEKPDNGLATVEAVDNRNGEVKDLSDAGDMKHNGVIDKLKETISELSTTVEGTGAREFGNLSSSKKLIDQKNEKIKAGKSDLRSEDLVDGDEGEKPNNGLATVEAVDNGNGKVKDSSDAGDMKHNGVIDKLKDTISELSTSVEGTGAREFGNSSSSKKLIDQTNEKIEAGKTDLRSEFHDGFQSQLPDEMMDKVKDIHCVTEESEKKAENDQQDKQSTEVTLEQEMQHAPVSSFSSKAEESGKKADTVQELKQNISVIREREIPPAPLPSSSLKSINSATPTSHPAGLGRAAPLLEPAPRMVQQPRVNGTVSQAQLRQNEDPANGEAEESDETREKLQLIRVKFLRLAHRLGQTPHNVVVAQVLYRLGLAEQLRGRNGGRVGAFSFDRASAMAEQLEAAGDEPLDFSCTIMVLGKTGVGKSATINSIFDEVKFGTDAFQTGTKKVQDVLGTVHGIKVRVIDTPGLLPSWSDQRQNEKILHSVKRFIKKTPPDIVLYLDRLDMQTRDFGDMPLLRTITEIFGPSLWFNAIVVLTHAASAPPDGPNGTASSYDTFVTQRSHVVQQAIRHAAGDMRLMNPVSLVENHSACRTNRAGQRVLPNGQVWKPHLLLLSFASKILAEANTLLKLQDTPPGKPFATRTRTLPLPFLLSSLLQSRQQVKLPEEQYGDEDSSDDDLVESFDSGDESEYDELPPFKRLTKAQIARLTKAQKKAYFDELEYREKLFMKKQLKEEKKRRKMMKKMAAAAKDLASEYGDNTEEESSGASSVPVPVPDLALPASFDSDNPTHRYRYLDSSNPWLVRPVLDTHGWDHDVGYEGINVERLFVAKDKFPISFSGQITKDKKDANIQMELASSLKHGEGKATSLGFDMQTVGKDLSYTMRSETRFSNFRKNKATAGISVTLLGDALSAGVKVEDKLIANKRFQVVMTGGAMTGRGDLAYGGSLEARLRDKDYPIGRSSSTLGLSIVDWHGDLAIGCNIQSQVPVGRSTNLIARVNLNNRGAGQVSIRINSTEQLQLALISLLPLLKKLLDYPQQMQY